MIIISHHRASSVAIIVKVSSVVVSRHRHNVMSPKPPSHKGRFPGPLKEQGMIGAPESVGKKGKELQGEGKQQNEKGETKKKKATHVYFTVFKCFHIWK